MKSLLISAACFSAFFGTLSQAHVVEHNEGNEECLFVGQVGEFAMENRQAGVELNAVKQSVTASGQPLDVLQIYNSAVDGAYNLPILESDSQKRLEILRFGEQLSAECFDSFEE